MTDRKFRLARLWSNNELRRVANFFAGDIVNASAWDDRDKEGSYYKNYFKNASGYYYTNYTGKSGLSNLKNEFFCDLTKSLQKELENRFDVVFNHTTLEHIFDVKTAFSNICKMSRDVVIIVVPFCQVQHGNDDWDDYWRFTPSVMRKLFTENGLTVIYESANNNKNSAIYLFYIATRNQSKWENMLGKNKLSNCGQWIGESIVDIIVRIVKRIKFFH